MAFCGKCGTQIEDGVQFCPGCGAATDAPAQEQPRQAQQPQQNDFASKISGLNNTADTTAEYEAQDIEQNKAMAILAYFGILVLIPMFAAKESKFARYHTNQGLILAIVDVAYVIVSTILRSIIKTPVWWGYATPGWLTTILWIISIPLFVLSIMGIINAVNGKAKELPVIGKIKILK